MKAVVCTKYGPPEVLQIKEVQQPVVKNNEILIKIKATTATVADHRIRSFNVPKSVWVPARLTIGITKPRKPILGVELAGKVEAVGKNVTKFKRGDEVFASTLKDFGAYAEYKCLPDDAQIAIKPANITFEEAAAIPIGARTALHYLKKGGIQAGQKVLIYGASGSVGTYATQLAKYFRAKVTGVCSRSNHEMVLALGAEKVIDYTQLNWTKKLEVYDMIFIAVDKWPFTICNKFLKEKGVYVNVTSPIRSFRMLWVSITGKKRLLMGENPPDSAEDLNLLKALVESGNLRAIIDRSYTLNEIVEAHRYVSKGHKKGNVVITVV